MESSSESSGEEETMSISDTKSSATESHTEFIDSKILIDDSSHEPIKEQLSSVLVSKAEQGSQINNDHESLEKKRGPFLIIILVLIALVVIALLIIFFHYTSRSGKRNEHEVVSKKLYLDQETHRNLETKAQIYKNVELREQMHKNTLNAPTASTLTKGESESFPDSKKNFYGEMPDLISSVPEESDPHYEHRVKIKKMLLRTLPSKAYYYKYFEEPSHLQEHEADSLEYWLKQRFINKILTSNALVEYKEEMLEESFRVCEQMLWDILDSIVDPKREKGFITRFLELMSRYVFITWSFGLLDLQSALEILGEFYELCEWNGCDCSYLRCVYSVGSSFGSQMLDRFFGDIRAFKDLFHRYMRAHFSDNILFFEESSALSTGLHLLQLMLKVRKLEQDTLAVLSIPIKVIDQMLGELMVYCLVGRDLKKEHYQSAVESVLKGWRRPVLLNAVTKLHTFAFKIEYNDTDRATIASNDRGKECYKLSIYNSWDHEDKHKAIKRIDNFLDLRCYKVYALSVKVDSFKELLEKLNYLDVSDSATSGLNKDFYVTPAIIYGSKFTDPPAEPVEVTDPKPEDTIAEQHTYTCGSSNLWHWIRGSQDGDFGYLIEFMLRAQNIRLAIDNLTKGFQSLKSVLDTLHIEYPTNDLGALAELLNNSTREQRLAVKYMCWVMEWPMFKIFIPQAIIELSRIIESERLVSKNRAEKLSAFVKTQWQAKFGAMDGMVRDVLLDSIEPSMQAFCKTKDTKLTPLVPKKRDGKVDEQITESIANTLKHLDKKLAQTCSKTSSSHDKYKCLGELLKTVTLPDMPVSTDSQLPQTAQALANWTDSDWESISPAVGYMFIRSFLDNVPWYLVGFLKAEHLSLPLRKLASNWRAPEEYIKNQPSSKRIKSGAYPANMERYIPVPVYETESDFEQMANWMQLRFGPRTHLRHILPESFLESNLTLIDLKDKLPYLFSHSPEAESRQALIKDIIDELFPKVIKVHTEMLCGLDRDVIDHSYFGSVEIRSLLMRESGTNYVCLLPVGDLELFKQSLEQYLAKKQPPTAPSGGDDKPKP